MTAALGRRAPSPRAPVSHSPIASRAGIGLRFPHHRTILDERPDVGWLEAHAENYMGGGTSLACLEAIRRDHAVALHGVGLSLGGADDLDAGHLARLCTLVDRIAPALVSEHLAWSVVDGTYLADLLPLPLTEEALGVVCRHVDVLQAALRRQILVENPATCLRFVHSTIPEAEFLAAVTKRTGCGILCDVNNVYVSACNHGFDAAAYLAALPPAAIGEFHLAGHAIRDLAGGRTLRIDDHGSRVQPAVWTLYRDALARFGPRPTLIEWDTAIPPLDVLLDEAAKATQIMTEHDEASNAVAA